jgi:penicillin-insensitive murein endopeptidase
MSDENVLRGSSTPLTSLAGAVFATLRLSFVLPVIILLAGIGPALPQQAQSPAQDPDTLDPTPPGSLNPELLPPLENPNSPKTPAKQLFARKVTPFPGPPRSIGGYADGCLAGATALPIDGPTWQVMRLSRNRNWGHPNLIAFLEQLADNAKKIGWNGLLIGDMSQPRGGPMINGHSSHQIGLDADIWFTPMPNHVQSREEREFSFPPDIVAKNQQDVDPEVWTHTRTDLIRTAAQDPAVTRIFVNAAIKKALCRESGPDRTWLAKVRPWYGHAEHFHIRIGCPADSPACKSQPPVPAGDGCGRELDYWIKHPVLPPAPSPIPEKPKPGITLARLPAACKEIVMAP